MKPRVFMPRYRLYIRLVLIALILGGIAVAISLRELPINANYQFIQITGGDKVVMPTSLSASPDNTYHYVTQRDGVIRVLENGVVLDEPFVDMRDVVLADHIEQGLHRILLDPNVDENDYFYVYYTARPDGTVRVERYEFASPTAVDRESATIIIEIEQPAAYHNGGEMQFGLDGYLYIGVGDGGNSSSTSSDLSNHLGTILRLDVSEMPYIVPEDNPFVNEEDALPEIWAYGLRNPWRFSFDSETGDLFIGDVGSEKWEEVNWIPAPATGGYDFGWARYEATHLIGENEPDDNVTMPMYEYSHNQEGIDARKFQCAVTGGYLYRGEALPDLTGTYIFGDWCSGSIWSLKQDESDEWVYEPFIETEFKLNSFGVDAEGEIYLLTVANGIWKLTGR